MRELVLTVEQQEFISFVTYDFCEWLYKKKLLAEDSYAAFRRLRQEHMDMWRRACAAADKIDSSALRGKGTTNRREFVGRGRHDIARHQLSKHTVRSAFVTD